MAELSEIQFRIQNQIERGRFDQAQEMLPDAFTLAPQFGGVMLAVRSQGASMNDVFKARRGLVASHANVIGTVMTYAR